MKYYRVGVALDANLVIAEVSSNNLFNQPYTEKYIVHRVGSWDREL